MADVVLKLGPLPDLANLSARHGKRIFKLWAIRYRSFAKLRFDRFSKGAGDWPPLKASTIKRRRTGRRVKRVGRKTSILRDTNTLYTALNPTLQPGAIESPIIDGVKVGFGGPSRHPSGDVTIADIAGFHQAGKGNLPVREIIVEPDRKTLNGMSDDVVRFARKITK